MLILLPPSEGKSPAPQDREPVDFSLLHNSDLNPARERVLEVLRQVSGQENALALLKVGKSLASEIERNQYLLSEPAAEASSVYSGVLYDALDYQSLTTKQQALADEHVLIVSALWGIVRLDDAIPAYRLSMGTKLGELGGLASFWKPHLATALSKHLAGQLILDARSADYQKALPTPPESTYLIKPVSVFEDGTRKTISHSAKHYRGLLIRWILTHRLADCQDINHLIKSLQTDWDCELKPPQGRKAGELILLIPAS